MSAATNDDVLCGADGWALASVIAVRVGIVVTGTVTVGSAATGTVTRASASVPCVGLGELIV